MPNDADHQQPHQVAIEPFLLDNASEAFLKGDHRGIRSRLRIGNEFPLVVLAGVALMFLSIAMVQQLVALNSPSTKQPTGQDLLTSVALIICCSYFIVWKMKDEASKERLLRDGRVLEGTVVRCSGRKRGNGDESWYSVKVEYRFISPQQRDITRQSERDRDDLANLPLPAEGTPVLVLYLHENCHVLL